MTFVEKEKAIQYVESLTTPAELAFFAKEQLIELQKEREKMDRSIVFVSTIIDKPDFESQLQKGELEGRIYGPSEMANTTAKFRVLDDGWGERIDLNETLVNKTGQRIIMSGRLQKLLGFLADGYMIKDEMDQLISALQADNVSSTDVDRVTSAMSLYGAIALQRGAFVSLKNLLEEATGRNLSYYNPALTPKPKPLTPLPVPEHGATLNSLKERLTTPHAAKPGPHPVSFKHELDREVNTPELSAHEDQAAINSPKSLRKPPVLEDKPILPPIKEKNEVLDQDAAWRLSNKVVVPKFDVEMPIPQPSAVPKVRNRTARHGLVDLNALSRIDQLDKIEPAHLRQGPLSGQTQLIKNKIAQLAKENEMLPVSLLPKFVQSPLFQVYLKAGSIMIDRNMTASKVALESVMSELEAQGNDTLSQQEFEAVADLKKELEAMSGL